MVDIDDFTDDLVFLEQMAEHKILKNKCQGVRASNRRVVELGDKHSTTNLKQDKKFKQNIQKLQMLEMLVYGAVSMACCLGDP